MPQIFYLPIVYIVVLLTSYIGVSVFLKWSLRRGLIDVPNERSSHTVPTPRGGGIMIVFICLIFYTIYTVYISGTFSFAYVGGSILIAFISWLDDLFDVSFLIRVLIHASAAFLIVYFVGFFEYFYIPFFGQIIKNDFWSVLISFLWIVWLTNAFNFMDGIDGIAGVQTVTAGFGWIAVSLLYGSFTFAFYGGVIAFAGLGFLILNWQPAKVFMGDVGSAFLGFTFAVLPLLISESNDLTVEYSAMLPTLAIFLNWFFLFDTVYTLFKRILKKEKVWKAHRDHLYQQLVIAGYQHQTVTIFYGLLSSLIILALILRLKFGTAMDLIFAAIVLFLTIGLLLIKYFAAKREKLLIN